MDVFGLGQCSLDHIGKTDSYPPPDVKCEFSGLAVQGGGPVATAMVALSRWGASCAFTGVVGDDRFGEAILSSLAEERVDVSRVLRRPGSSSQFAFILAEPASGHRTIFWQRPTGPAAAARELDMVALGAARLFYTDGFFLEASLAAAAEARRRGVPVLVDAGTLRDGMLELAAMADHFVVSEVFARSFSGKGDPEEVCRRLAELGPPVVGVTLGKGGYASMISGRFSRGPAYPAQVVDTTGCGDVFHAGCALGILRGWPPERGLQFGAWAAARVAEHPGGRAGIPKEGEYPG